MRRFDKYADKDTGFWAVVKYVSESLGYSKGGKVNTYSSKDIETALRKNRLFVDQDQIADVKDYLDLRAELLNGHVESCLMDAATAKIEYEKLSQIYSDEKFLSKLPLNKQKGEMRQIAYFTAMINIIAEKTIKEFGKETTGIGFNDDPRGLVYILDSERRLIGSTSRRYDGAFPDIINPLIVWEIKEYYYATTFGSRVADGVYETQLDGFEFKKIEKSTGIHIEHVYFIDAYRTWWTQGKSYLCRIIDALNIGLVDEVIVGREVLSRWPELIKQFL